MTTDVDTQFDTSRASQIASLQDARLRYQGDVARFESGIAQGYFDRPEWHQLGNVEIGGITDVDRVLELAGLDFEVLQRPVRYFDDGGALRTLDNSFVNYRSDNGVGLGAVGRIYTPVQNRDGAQFLQSLVDDFGARFTSAFPLNDGKRVVVSMKLPEDIVIDADGIGDHVELYLAWFNNHDGQGQAECK